ncbi:DUF2914 domain-containing protein [Rheinheimera riviphila]|uniref:DUF2914 domain-containing protein n=1 Tax=Rheinheimera riviphila TaxID=1834037 RepID=A0A437R5N5_9GAMM|nr:DUF2914 domain-containing protein [Rheinheimera riviphila]RVU42021.1 DUF2914 domain-containing protein [Rheinheimera riviphila]
MTEQAAKLTVKVKLHAAQPVVLPTAAAPARLSKMKVTLGLLLLVLLTAAGYLLWQQFVGKVPSAVAADHLQAIEVSAVATEEMVVIPTPDELVQNPATDGEQASAPAAAQQNIVTEKTVEDTIGTTAQAEVATTGQTQTQAAIPKTGRSLPKGFSRIVLAATMEQLEPGAAIDTLVAQQQIQRLYLFTELQGYAGQQLIHRWSFAGQVQTEALLTIEDSPWRTYSEKWLLPDQLGSWRVEIVDQQQNVLYQHDFQYQ